MADGGIFKDNGDGTVTALESNLLWLKRDSHAELGKWLNWEEAVEFTRVCNRQKYLGYNDWRMPTRNELRGLCRDKEAYRAMFMGGEPAKTPRKVSNYKAGGETSYWTCETREDAYAWKYYFPGGREVCVDPVVSTAGTVARLVRNLP